LRRWARLLFRRTLCDFAPDSIRQPDRFSSKLLRAVVREEIEVDTVCSGISRHQTRSRGNLRLRQIRRDRPRHIANVIFRWGHQQRTQIEVELIVGERKKYSGQQSEIDEGQGEDARRQFHGDWFITRASRLVSTSDNQHCVQSG
jgi:hypothetical protein